MHDTNTCRILMILENECYPEDTRVRLEATTLVEHGYSVAVICPTDGNHKACHETVEGVEIYRYPGISSSGGSLGFLLEYTYSFLMASSISFYLWIRQGFDVVHVHAPPDLNGNLGIFYKMVGKKFVFDHHDLSPELFQAQGRQSNILAGLLRAFEKLSCRAADVVIETNQTQLAIQSQRTGLAIDKCAIVRNGPSEFFLGDHEPFKYDFDGVVIGFVGVMGEQDGVDALIRALHNLKSELRRDDFLAVLIGAGRASLELQDLVDTLNLKDQVIFTGRIPHEMVPKYIAGFDIGTTPDPSNPYNDSCTTIKTMEYMALSKPVVAFDTPENRVTAGDGAIYVGGNDERAFAEALARLMDDSGLRQKMGQAGRQRIVDGLAWSHQSKQLISVYRSFNSACPK